MFRDEIFLQMPRVVHNLVMIQTVLLHESCGSLDRGDGLAAGTKTYLKLFL